MRCESSSRERRIGFVSIADGGRCGSNAQVYHGNGRSHSDTSCSRRAPEYSSSEVRYTSSTVRCGVIAGPAGSDRKLIAIGLALEEVFGRLPAPKR